MFKIGTRLVGSFEKPLVIAELGINHNGDLSLAKEIVDAAARAGAEVVKHQTHIPEEEMAEDAKDIVPDNADCSIFEVISSRSLNESDELELKRYIESKGMIFLSTPFSLAAVDRLEKFGVKAYKIGSGECNNLPLIKKIIQTGKPIVLSTGMNDLRSILASVSLIEKAQVPYAILHCTNVYPSPYETVRLSCLSELQEKFPSAPVGLSDHTGEIYTSVAAIAFGASILELHFIDKKDGRYGPDISASIDEAQLKELIRIAPLIKSSVVGRKGIVEQEKSVANFAFASVVALTNISKGTKLERFMLTVKRPGTGIPASEIDNVIGKIAAQEIKAGYVVKSEMING